MIEGVSHDPVVTCVNGSGCGGGSSQCQQRRSIKVAMKSEKEEFAKQRNNRQLV